MAMRGFTMFFAVLISGLALAIGVAVYDLATRQLALSQTTAQSQYAIYAADTGAECALYWDAKAPMLNGVSSAFGTSSNGAVSGITCNKQDIAQFGTPNNNNPVDLPVSNWKPWVVTLAGGTNPTTTTTFLLLLGSPRTATSSCALVQVGKSTIAGTPRTSITAHGYSNCVSGSATQVERILQLNY